jgi:hypothetical protein
MKSLGTYNTFSNLPLVTSILPLSVTSTEELSPIIIGGPLHESSEEYTYFVSSMWCDAPEYMIQASREKLMAIKAWIEFVLLGF